MKSQRLCVFVGSFHIFSSNPTTHSFSKKNPTFAKSSLTLAYALILSQSLLKDPSNATEPTAKHPLPNHSLPLILT